MTHGRTWCVECGDEFKKKSLNHKFCSVDCGNAYHKNKYEKNKKLTHFDIFKSDDFRCQYCGKTPSDGVKLVVDHIYPIAKGGGADRFNLTTACEDCNTSKSNKLLGLKETVRRFNLNDEKFTYKEAKKFWEADKNNRTRGIP